MTDIRLGTLEELTAELESNEFYCEVAVASSVTALEKQIAKNPITQKLQRLIKANPDNSGSVVEYASGIAHSVIGATRSDNDAALCACIFALADTDFSGVDELLNFVRSSPESGLWWASKLVTHLAQKRTATVINVEPHREVRLYSDSGQIVFNMRAAA